MPTHPVRSAQEWFEEAARAYVAGHQACAWCGGRYQVYKGQRGSRLEYYCPGCDFYAFHDPSTGRYFAAPGHEGAGRAVTARPALAAAIMPSGADAGDASPR
jgi:hypothetical protein